MARTISGPPVPAVGDVYTSSRPSGEIETASATGISGTSTRKRVTALASVLRGKTNTVIVMATTSSETTASAICA